MDRSSSLEDRKHKRGDSNPPGDPKTPTTSIKNASQPVSSVRSPGPLSRSSRSTTTSNTPAVVSPSTEEDALPVSSSRLRTVNSGSFEILESRTADEQTRQFLLEVVRSHEEGIREADELLNVSVPGIVAVSDRKKPRAPTVKLMGTWSKSSGRRAIGTDGSVMSWSSLGLDAMSEQEGGTPQAVFQVVQYFVEKRCYNYPGLFKTPGSPAKGNPLQFLSFFRSPGLFFLCAPVNRIMETLADGSFAGFDALEATPLDVLASLRTFLLIVPESPVPGSLFYELLDACYEVDKGTQVAQVRGLLMRVSAACRGVLKAVLDLCRGVLASQSTLQLGDVAQYLAPGLVRPAEGTPAETDPQSYAIVLALLELGNAAFDAKAQPERAVLAVMAAAPAADNGRVTELEEELKQANEKIASLTRQLDEARKGSNVLKKKLDVAAKETSDLKRKLAENQKIIDSWKANAVLDMY